MLSGATCVRRPAPPVVTIVTTPKAESCFLEHHPTVFITSLTSNFSYSMFIKESESVFNSSNETFHNVTFENKIVFKRDKPIAKAEYQELQKILTSKSSKVWKQHYTIYLSSLRNQVFTQLYGIDMSRTFPQQRICAELKLFNMNEGNFTTKCGIEIQNKTYTSTDTVFWVTFRNGRANKSFAVCEKYHLHSSCILTTIKSNYTIDENKTLIYYRELSKSKFYQVDEYVPLRNGYGVCNTGTPTIKTYKWIETVQNVEYYISIVGCSISIVCYLWILITFALYSELRNLPGLNTMALCSALLLADLSFIIGVENNDNEKICKSFGIILHWALLTTSMWVVVVAYDLSVKFSTIKVSGKHNFKKMFIRYFIVAVTIPTLIVGVTVLLDATDAIKVGYGENNVCWIGRFYALLASYIIPVSIIYILTGSALVYTIYNIHVENKRSNKILGTSSGRENINVRKVALKLVCILGITEGLGFVQIHGFNLKQNELIFNSVFGVAYGFTRSLRGLVLWMVYICNERVLSLYKSSHKKSIQTESKDRGSTLALTDLSVNK